MAEHTCKKSGLDKAAGLAHAIITHVCIEAAQTKMLRNQSPSSWLECTILQPQNGSNRTRTCVVSFLGLAEAVLGALNPSLQPRS